MAAAKRLWPSGEASREHGKRAGSNSGTAPVAQPNYLVRRRAWLGRRTSQGTLLAGVSGSVAVFLAPSVPHRTHLPVDSPNLFADLPCRLLLLRSKRDGADPPGPLATAPTNSTPQRKTNHTPPSP